MTKNWTIGLITDEREIGEEEQLFRKCARERGAKLVLINLARKFNEREFERKVRQCDIIYNDEAADYVIELLKVAEELGVPVLDPSDLFYYAEDKWLFYVKCKKNKIPTLESALLPKDLVLARRELKDFGHWPVILKRLHGFHGNFVRRADNLKEAMAIVKAFWDKDADRLPIVAQEFVKSYAYRVTTIGDEIVQTAVKKSKNWKCTGYYANRIESFPMTPELKKIVEKTVKVFKINVCGIDLVKKGSKWLVLEVNAEPGLTFIEGDRERLIRLVIDLILRKLGKRQKKRGGKKSK